jgi:hypothetical protein
MNGTLDGMREVKEYIPRVEQVERKKASGKSR